MSKEPSARLPIVVFILALVGLSLSGLSLYEFASLVLGKEFGVESKPSFCNINATFNCDAVTLSRWSVVWGIPLASYGFVFYSGLLALALLSPLSRVVFESVTLFSSFLATIASVFLFLISKYEIGPLCLVCIGMYLVNISLLIVSLAWKGAPSAFMSLISGVKYCLGWIPASIGILADAAGQRIARISLLVVVLAALASVALPHYLFFKFIVPTAIAENEPTPEEISAEIKAQLAAWASAEAFPSVSAARESDYKRGAVGSPITVVEYADFECPACQQYYLINEELLTNYGEKVLYVFRNYPLDSGCNPGIKHSFHLNSCYAAELSLCAGEQGKYWEYSDYLFTLNHEEIAKEEVRNVMIGGVQSLNLNREEIDNCLASGRNRGRISSEIKEADELKLRGTPTIFVNGKLVENFSYPVMAAIFDEILKQSGQ